VRYILLWCQAVLVGVFLASVVTKVQGRAALTGFVSWVDALRLLPRRWARPAAYSAIAAEAGAAVLSAVPTSAPLGFAGGAALLSVFTAGIAAKIRAGDRMPCRCFGASTTRLGWSHVVRNLTLLAVCIAGLAASAAAAGSAWHPVAVTVTLVSAAAVVLLVVRFDDLAALLTPDAR
jgi:hypothetical protein